MGTLITEGNRRTEFKWKLDMVSIVEPNEKVKMAIESIHCRDMSFLLKEHVGGTVLPHDEIAYAGSATHGTTYWNEQIATVIGNTDEKELYLLDVEM